MSKKNKYKFAANPASNSQAAAAFTNEHAEEYRFVQNDLIRLIIVNAIFLAGMLTLYYTNLHSHYLEHLFSKLHI